jgi:hypothetical protein
VRTSNAQLARQLQEQEAKRNEELTLSFTLIDIQLNSGLSEDMSSSHPSEAPAQQRPVPSEGSFASCEVLQPLPHQLVRATLETAPGEVDTELKLT